MTASGGSSASPGDMEGSGLPALPHTSSSPAVLAACDMFQLLNRSLHHPHHQTIDSSHSVLRLSELNMTGDKELYENVYRVLYGFGLPTICVFGFLGNVLNLLILAGKRIQRSLRNRERSANVGLISLAVADLCFCFTAFPSTFLPQNSEFETKGIQLYYGCYCAAVINIFIMTSTWLTVIMATERYLAICHPLKSRDIIALPRTKVVIVMVYFLSAVFNIPVFWRYEIGETSCNNVTRYVLNPQKPGGETFDHAYRATWAILGNFLPLVMLLIFNIGLMREIHKSYAMRKLMNGNAGIRTRNQHEIETSNRITITLIAIVALFFILVAPSELLKHVAYLASGQNLQKNYTYLTIEIITNVMQTMNFSANFILYCIINPSFRRTMRAMVSFRHRDLSRKGSYYDQFLCDNSSIRMASFRGPSSSIRAASLYVPTPNHHRHSLYVARAKAQWGVRAGPAAAAAAPNAQTLQSRSNSIAT